MLIDTDYYRQKLKYTHTRIGEDDWQQAVENIPDFSIIEPLFDEYQDLIKDEENNDEGKFHTFHSLINDKFAHCRQMNSYYGQKKVPQLIDTNNNIWFDMTDYPNYLLAFEPSLKLKALEIAISPVKQINFSNLINLQVLSLIRLRNVHDFIPHDLSKLRYLNIAYCPNVKNLATFASATNVRIACFDNNKRLENIEFLANYQKLVSLNIVNLNILDKPETYEILASLKSLKFLYTGRLQKAHKALLKEALPHCYGF